MDKSDESLLLNIMRPSRYIGNEINSVKKAMEKVDVTIALAFPDLYEVGMSHQGLKILCHILNNHEWLAAERVFSPWVDMERELREKGRPICSLDSNIPLSRFDIIGFSLQHELLYTNVLTMLDLSDIPFLSSERGDPFPLIIAGGPACFNPEPIASIFDAIVIGDGEDAAYEICRAVREGKRHGIRKDELLRELAKIDGVYVPSLFNVYYKDNGVISAIESVDPACKTVKKAIIPNIDKYSFPDDQAVPFTRLVHDRLAVEISRGCTRGCRFCQAGMVYRPVRDRSPESVMKNVENALRKTGFDEISLLSLSSGDYACIAPLIRELMDRLSEDRVAVSLPSLRIDSLNPEWFEQIKRVRKTGFTLAAESGNDRLRGIINKSLTDKDILKMAQDVYGAGWNLIKLYFMIGLPGELDEDRRDIVHLARKVVSFAGKGRKIKLNVSVATFVPKAHTPFMWEPQISLDESRRFINQIQSDLRGSRVRVKWNSPELSWLEGIFSRGDRRLTGPLIDAWKSGARFDAWGEHFNMEIWKRAFERAGLSPDFYLYRRRSIDEILPWDHISAGVTKAFLIREYKRAGEGKLTPDCRDKCIECGVCNHEDINPVICRYRDLARDDEGLVSSKRSHDTGKYRITFSKTGRAVYLGHLELSNVFIRAFRRAGLDLIFSKGFHPMPKVSFLAALPLGIESLHETVDIQLYRKLTIQELKQAIGEQLPEGINLVQLEDITGQKKGFLKESHYRITVKGHELNRSDLDDFLAAKRFHVNKSTKNGEKYVDIRPLVKIMDLTHPSLLDMVLGHVRGPGLKPVDIVKNIFKIKDLAYSDIKVLKIRQVIG